MNRADIFAAIDVERDRQEAIHPGWPWNDEPVHDMGRMDVLSSEVEEVHDAMVGYNGDLREELIHVASVCCRWLEALDA